MPAKTGAGLHARIHAVVRRIPRGRLATYGQIARLAGLASHARLVGYAMAALPGASAVPWQRVVNAQGRVSPRSTPGGDGLQRALLEREGVRFDAQDRIDLERFGWRPRESWRRPAASVITRPPASRRSAMARSHWLVKTEPSRYAWDDLVRDGGTRWDGVRNALARNHLAAMRKGDLALVYHSGDEKAVVGLARIGRAAYPDPSADDPKWLAVDLAALRPLAKPVALAAIRKDALLARLALVRQSRLSVMPVDDAAFARILALGGTKAPR